MSNLGPHAADTRRSGDHSRSWGKEVIRQGEDDKDPDDSNAVVSANVGDNTGSPPKHSNNLMHLSFGAHRHPLDPHDPHGYRHAKRRLRKAAIEHYRYVERKFVLWNLAIADVGSPAQRGRFVLLIVDTMLTCGVYLQGP